MSLALLDTILLRVLSDPRYTAKGSALTWIELDTNIKIIADAITEVGTPNTTGGFDPYDNGQEYSDVAPDYVSYSGNIWEFINPIPQTGITPGSDPLSWQIVSLGQFSHERNKDQYVDFGGSFETSAEDIFNKINEPPADPGLPFTDWDNTKTYNENDTAFRNGLIYYSLIDNNTTDPEMGDWGLLITNTNAYGVLWSNSVRSPTQDAVYDKIESIVASMFTEADADLLYYKLDGSTPLAGHMDADGFDIFGIDTLTASSVICQGVTAGTQIEVGSGSDYLKILGRYIYDFAGGVSWDVVNRATYTAGFILSINAGGRTLNRATTGATVLDYSDYLKTAFDFELSDAATAYYIGPKGTDGSCRTRIESGILVDEIRISGVWTKIKESFSLFQSFADSGNGTTVETDMHSYTTAAGLLENNGEKIEAEYGGVFVSSATATRQIKIYFGGTAIFDTGTLTLSLSSAWTAYVTIIRVSSTVVRCMVSFTTEGAALAAYTDVIEVTGLTLSSTNILKITGQAAGVGAASNDIVLKLSQGKFVPSA